MIADPEWPVLVAAVLLLAVWAVTVRRHRAWRRRSTWRRLVMLLLVGVVGLQFQQADPVTAEPSGVDIVLVVDRTTSMGAQDWAGLQPRMEGVAHDVAALTRALPNARYSVVVSDNEARVSLPWSTDTAALRTLAETMGWRDAAHGTGSDISAGLELAVELLNTSAEARPGATRYLVYFGDGEQTGAQEPRSFEDAAALISDALVLGYGTTSGGRMAVRQGSEDLVLVDGEPATSVLDPGALQQIADQLGGRFVHRNGPGGLTFWPDGTEPAAAPEPGRFVVSVSWLAALALLPLVALELWHSVQVLLAARKELAP